MQAVGTKYSVVDGIFTVTGNIIESFTIQDLIGI